MDHRLGSAEDSMEAGSAARDSSRPETPPAEGERRAVRGYRGQYRVAAVLILDALETGLEWVRVADPAAGRVDDVQIATPGRLDACQVKWSRSPGSLTWSRLLEPTSEGPSLMRQLADGWRRLRDERPERRVVVHLITNDRPSRTSTARGPLDKFLLEVWAFRSAGSAGIDPGWTQAWEDCRTAAGLDPEEFDRFVQACELEASFAIERSPHSSIPQHLPLGASDIADLLWNTVGLPETVIELSRDELLEQLGWTHLFRLRHLHDFPLDMRIYRPPVQSRAELERVLDRGLNGYAAVVGPPGSGKSSLLTDTLRLRAERVVRYYAFVPGDAAVAARGEAAAFLHDMVFRFRQEGFGSRGRLRDDPRWLREEFALQLADLGRQFQESGRRTVILVDGLDHTVRQPAPQRPLLVELPQPGAIPDGVLVVLGTQTTELDQISPEIRVLVRSPERRVELTGLETSRVDEVIDAWGIEPDLDDAERTRIRQVANGHPLSLAYALRSLEDAQTPEERASRLDMTPTYTGDLGAYYEAHWGILAADPQIADTLALAARLRGSVNVPWFVQQLDAPGLGTRLEDRAGQYFRRPNPSRWTFFHDSFRQFLVTRTERDDAAFHRRLATWMDAEPSSPEVLYHRIKSGDDEGALNLARFDFFRRQFLARRPPEAISRDIRLLAAVAARHRRIPELVRLLFVDAEIGQRGYMVDREDLVQVLGDLGDIDAAVEYALEPARLANPARPAVYASLALARSNAIEAARELLDRESSEMLRHPGNFAQDVARDTRVWARAAARLLSHSALAETIAALRTSDAEAQPRTPMFVSSAAAELSKIGRDDEALDLARTLDLQNDSEREARASTFVTLIEKERRSGNIERHAELVGEASRDLRGHALTVETLYRLGLEVCAADPDHCPTFDPPGSIDQTMMEGFSRYRPFVSWIALLFAARERPDVDDEIARLGPMADRRVGRVAFLLGRVTGTAVRRSLDVWTFRETALEILRAFVLGRSRRAMDDYPLETVRHAVHSRLIEAAASHGPAHLDALFSLFEEEWARPRLGWSEDVVRDVLRGFVKAGGFDGRVRPHLDRLSEQDPGGDVGSRYTTWLSRATAWIEIGERDRASEAVDQALETSFGVGYRKDYQLEQWLDWLGRVNAVEPDLALHRIARVAAALPDLDESTEGRATELAATDLIDIAGRHSPEAAGHLLEWFLEVGAVTFHGGNSALLKRALLADASPRAVARFAAAWTVPTEREGDFALAAALCRAIRATGSAEGARSILDALQHYALQTVRPSWAALLREELQAAGLITPAAVDSLEESGVSPPDGSSGSGLPADEPRDLEDLENLAAWLSSDRYISSDAIREHVRPLAQRLANDELKAIAGISACPSTALVVAAEELLTRGDHASAVSVAEAALERRNPPGWDRMWDGGSVIDILSTLQRMAPARARELAFSALGEDLASASVDSTLVLRSLPDVLALLTDDPMEVLVWSCLEEYLVALLDLDRPRPGPVLEAREPASFDAVLARIAAVRLRHPVTLIAQLSREALAAEVLSGSTAAIDQIRSVLESGLAGTVQSGLGVLEVVAVGSGHGIEEFRGLLEGLLRSPWLDVRLVAMRLLGAAPDVLPQPPAMHEPPAIYRITLPPTNRPVPERPWLVPEGQPLPDTESIAEIVQAFEGEIEVLADVSGRAPATIAGRIVEVVRELGLSAAFRSESEAGLIDLLDSIGLRHPYVRPRPAAIRIALGQVAAELLDHRYIEPTDAAALAEMLRWTDPHLDGAVLETLPGWLTRPMRPRDPYTRTSEWVADVSSRERPLPETPAGIVVAEVSQVRRLEWERPTEKRRRTLISADRAGAVAAGHARLFGEDMVSSTDYESAGGSGDPLFLLVSGIRFSTTKGPWLAVNPWVARSVGWRRDHGGLARWRGEDGETRVDTVLWMDGVVDAPSPELDDEPASGSYVVASSSSIRELEGLAAPLLCLEKVIREARDEGRPLSQTAIAYWDWRALLGGGG